MSLETRSKFSNKKKVTSKPYDSVNLHRFIEGLTTLEIFLENNKKQMTVLCHTVEPAVCLSDRMLVFSSARVLLSLRVSSCKACEKNERRTKTNR